KPKARIGEIPNAIEYHFDTHVCTSISCIVDTAQMAVYFETECLACGSKKLSVFETISTLTFDKYPARYCGWFYTRMIVQQYIYRTKRERVHMPGVQLD